MKKYEISREDEKTLYEAYYCLDRILNGFTIPPTYKETLEFVEKKLQDKDKEIKELKIDLIICYNKLIVNMKEIRHQICEEIIKLALSKYIEYGDYCVDVLMRSDLEYILHQIEKGE